jgi:hypothetical protein
MKEIKDTTELLVINATGIGLSLADIDALLRTIILVGTLIYTVFKVASIYRQWQKQQE